MATGVHCDGCLGTEKCWVCLGQGNFVDRRSCHRCHGTGWCPLCNQAKVIDLRAVVPVQRIDAATP